MKKTKELIKNTIIIMVGKISTQFISFLLLPLFTSYLTTAEYGTFDLIVTYIVLLVPIITLQLERSTFRFLIDYRNNIKKQKIVISNSYSIVLLISMLITIVFVIINVIFNIKYWIYLLFLVLVTISSNMLFQTCRGLGDNVGYSIGCIITGISNVIISVVLLMIFHFGIYSMLIANIGSNLLGTIYLSKRCKIYKYFSIKTLNKDFQKQLLKYSIPLIPNGLLWWIINSSDRTIITFIIGSSSNGIYSISNKFSYILNQLYNIFNLSWTESVSLYIDDKDDFISKMFNEIFVLICSGCLLLINSMFIIFKMLINIKFIEAYKYISILIIASIFNILSSNLGAIYIAKKETKQIAYTTTIAGVLNAIINVTLIKKIGLYAAAISTLIAFAVLFVLRYIGAKKYLNLKLDKKNTVLFTILFSVSLLIYEINNYYLNIITFIFTVIITFAINKEEIKKIYKKSLKFITKERGV